MKAEANPARYRDLCVPFPDREATVAAMDAFLDDVMAARVKHRIADVTLIMAVAQADGEGETTLMTSAHLGDSAKGLQLAAYHYGTESERHRSEIDRLASGKKRAR